MKTKRVFWFPVNAAYCIPMAFTVAGLVLCLIVSPALAQEKSPQEELKQRIKAEILEELRGDLPPATYVAIDVEALKKEIIQEILQELREQQESSSAAAEQIKEQIKQEVMREIAGDFTPRQTQEHPQSVRPATGYAGDAEGVILRKGVGLSGCRVKLVAFSGTGAGLRSYTKDQEYITITDKDGRYRFDQIPEGPYKIKWELPGDTGWIKRIRDRPDVTVVAGNLVVLKPIETARALVSQ